MTEKRCGGPEDKPDGQESRTTAVKTEDGCEYVHIDMETGKVTYTPAEDGACALEEEKPAKE